MAIAILKRCHPDKRNDRERDHSAREGTCCSAANRV